MAEKSQNDKAPPGRSVEDLLMGAIPHVQASEQVLQTLTGPIAHVWDGSGVYEVRQSHILYTAVQLAKGETRGIPKVLQEGFHLKIPKIPFMLLARTVTFFREIEKRHGAEAIVQIFWDEQARTFHLTVPRQEIGAASVHHDGPEAAYADMIIACEIHSHNTMAGFWSGTDDKDEERFPLRPFGVIGKILHPVPDMKWRIWSGVRFIDFAVEDLFDCGETFCADVNLLAVLKGEQAIDPFTNDLNGDPIVTPEDWFARCREPKPVVSRGRQPYYGDDYGDWWGWTDERPAWAANEGITEEQWKASVRRIEAEEREERRGKRKGRKRPHTVHDVAREARRMQPQATGNLSLLPPERGHVVTLADEDRDRPAGSLIYRHGKWWRRLADGRWVEDVYPLVDPRGRTT